MAEGRDLERFLQRECPHCLRQFRWRYQEPDMTSEAERMSPSDSDYFCPYCYEIAPANAWWTQDQLNSIKQ